VLAAPELLAELSRFGTDVDDEIVSVEARAVAEQLTRRTMNVLVVGQFKRGKSTVVNALLGEDLMPTGALPLTGVATSVRYGSPASITVELRNGERRSVSPAKLPLYVTERENPKNRLGVVRVDVVRYAPALQGITLFDTPGVGSIFRHNTAAARAMLPRADAAILVVGPEPPIGAEELAYAREVAQSSVKLFVLFNKADTAGPTLDELLAFTRDAIGDVTAESVEIFAASALRAREAQRVGRTEPGFARFLSALRTFVDEHGSEALAASLRRRTHVLLDRADAFLRMREQAIALPQTERAQRRAALESALQALDDRVRFLGLIVDDDVRHLRLKLDEELDRRHDRERAEFSERANEIAAEPSRDRRRDAIEAAIRDRAHAWRDEAVRHAEGEIAGCAAKYVRLFEELEEAVIRAGCDALHMTTDAFVSREIAFEPAKLTLAVSLDPATGLEVLRDAMTELMPAQLRRTLLRRRIARLLESELDALRGKLRYGIAHDLEPWRRSVRVTIASSLDATRAAVLSAFPVAGNDDEERRACENTLELRARFTAIRTAIEGTLSGVTT
jgi:signal recognition particle receptor subunit beta